MRNELDGGEGLLEAIRKLNVEHILASPGSEWAPIWEALARQDKENLDGPGYLDCWHEALAVDMAIGHGLITGKPQFAVLHAGAGLLQGAMAVHGAQQWEIPMVIASAESLTYGEGTGPEPGSQWYRALSIVGGPHRLMEPLVKYANQVTSIETLYEMAVRAGEMAQRAPRGPVYLNVPVETLLEEWTPADFARDVPKAPRVLSPEEDIAEIAGALAASQTPLVITEMAGRDADTFEALVELADTLAVPVLDGPGVVAGNFPKTHPMYQGLDLSPLADEADLILLVRCRTPWYPPSKRLGKGRIVAIDENPHARHLVHQSMQANDYLEGDAADSLRRLTAAALAAGPDSGVMEARRERLAKAHDERDATNRAAQAEARAKTPIDPVWLCGALAETMPDDVIYASEVTLHSGTVRQHVPWTRPQSYYCARGGLGQGLGLALGLKLGAPERPVVALMGDGGFLYNPVIQALGASRDHELPIMAIVFNNQKYAAMQGGYKRGYPDSIAIAEDNLRGVHINGPDYGDLAALFDGHGERVEDPEALPGALERGLAATKEGKLAVLNVVLAH